MMRRSCAPLPLAILLLIIGVLVIQFRSGGPRPEFISLNEVAHHLQEGDIVRLIVDGTDVEVVFNNGSSAFSRIEEEKTLVEQLRDLGVSEAQLSSQNVMIEVSAPHLFNADLLVPFIAIGGVGFILGALVMFLVIRSGYISVGDET